MFRRGAKRSDQRDYQLNVVGKAAFSKGGPHVQRTAHVDYKRGHREPGYGEWAGCSDRIARLVG